VATPTALFAIVPRTTIQRRKRRLGQPTSPRSHQPQQILSRLGGSTFKSDIDVGFEIHQRALAPEAQPYGQTA
jgi:hypothetical protein